MPLDDTWWDPAGPFGDNAEGAITAETMRQFAQAIAEQGVTGSWFSIMFAQPAITNIDWSVVDATRVLWLDHVPASFMYSDDWSEVVKDPNLIDTFLYEPTGGITIQVTFQPTTVNVTNATNGTTVTPVICLTLEETELPTALNTYVVGPTMPITSLDEDVDIGGYASVVLADTERAVRLGLRFNPPPGTSVTPGGTTFGVDPTGAGALVVARPLAPRAE